MEDPQQSNEALADSIAMLEQILEVMPQDTDAIKALYRAHFNRGNLERAFEHLNSLVSIVSSGGEPDTLLFLQSELPQFEEVYPSEVAAQVARLRMVEFSIGKNEETSTPSKPDSSSSEKNSVEVDISEELALAWRLYEENQLSQEEYSSVLHDLTEVSSKELDVPVSVLHVLNDRGFTQMTRILNYLSTRSGIPFISLANIELGDKIASALPLDISAHDGALPFSFLENDLLIGVLNPFNNMLVDRIETECGRRCHTYLVEPEDYDSALHKLRILVEES